MNIFKKAAISLAATSVLVAPVVASAQSAVSFGDARAVSASDDQSELAGSGLLLGLLALGAIVGGIVIAAGNNSDTPTSP